MQTSDLLNSAFHEIRDLRESNQIMGEKLSLVEGLLELRKLRGPNVGMSEDILPKLRSRAEELNAKEKEKSRDPSNDF